MSQEEAPLDHETLPGLRDYSGASASHDGHGIDEILDVIDQLSAAGIPSCVVGVRALRYYGAGRVTDEWDLCVPDDKLEEARQLLLGAERHGDDDDDDDDGGGGGGGGARYEVANPPFPVPGSLRHTFPCFRLRGYNFWFILVPSSDCFVDPSRAEHVERSRNGVPYAALAQFARSVLVQQLWADIDDLIDGMDLDVEWGERHLGFDALRGESVGFAQLRDERLKRCGSSSAFSPQDLEQIWRERASGEAKEARIEPMKKGRYLTRWRRIKNPEDPRTRDRLV